MADNDNNEPVDETLDLSAEKTQASDEVMTEIDDILSDLDLPDDVTSPAPSGGTEASSEIMDELDSFLEEFNDEMPGEGGAAANPDEEAVSAAGQGVELEPEELDLAAGLEELSLDEEPVQGVAADELELELGEDEVNLSASSKEAMGAEELLPEPEEEGTGDNVTPPSAQHAPEAETPGGKPQPDVAALLAAQQAAPVAAAAGAGSTVVVVSLVVAILAVVGAIGGIWMATGLQGQVVDLQNSLIELEAKYRDSAKGRNPDIERNTMELQRLTNRINELAVLIEGPISHLQQSSESEMKALEQRLTALEKRITVQSRSPRIKATTPKATTGRLQGESTGVISTRPAAVPGSWVVNLLSVTEAAAADSAIRDFRKQGIDAEKQTVSKDGKRWYRIRVTGFSSYAEAKGYIASNVGKAGVANAWVGRP